jgi:hypothetical protein
LFDHTLMSRDTYVHSCFAHITLTLTHSHKCARTFVHLHVCMCVLLMNHEWVVCMRCVHVRLCVCTCTSRCVQVCVCVCVCVIVFRSLAPILTLSSLIHVTSIPHMCVNLPSGQRKWKQVGLSTYYSSTRVGLCVVGATTVLYSDWQRETPCLNTHTHTHTHTSIPIPTHTPTTVQQHLLTRRGRGC